MFDARKLIIAAGLSLLLLGLCLAVLMVGIEVDVLDKQADSGDGVVAGPLTHGQILQQEIDIPAGIADEKLHLGFKFATYAKTNLGQIRVQVGQGDYLGEHSVDSTDLEDNEVLYFSFGGLGAGKALLTIEGVNGPDDLSATVWCSYSEELPSMLINGESSDRRVDVWFAHKTINKQIILDRVGAGGLVFLSLVFFAVITTVFYRAAVELKSIPVLAAGFLPLSGSMVRRWLMPSVSSLAAGMLVAAILLILSDKSVIFVPVGDKFSNERVPIEPLIEGAVVEQRFEITPQMSSGEIGVGLSFGTFLRNNKAKVEIKVSQGDKSDRVVLKSSTIVDGMERVFAFSRFDAGEATLTVTGLNGSGSNSPTIWFEPGSGEPRAVVNGESVDQHLILYRYLVVPDEGLFLVGGKAFPFKWMGITMLIVFILLQLRNGSRMN